MGVCALRPRDDTRSRARGVSINSTPHKSSVYIVAEVGSVHDGSFGNAGRLIDVAAECGADAVKFQTHLAVAETLRDAPMPSYFKGEPRYEYFQRTGFDKAEWKELRARAEEQSFDFISSPFSCEAVELLEEVGVARYKIASGEVTNLPLLDAVAQTGRPILLSSGMSTWAELDAAVNTILQHHDRLIVLQCTSAYPCPYEDVGLNVMAEMKERYSLPVGLSDHTATNYASFAAVALGAVVVEKHLTFSRLMYGSDAKHSLEPSEFGDLVRGIRATEIMLGEHVRKDASAARLHEMKEIFEKSIVSLVDIPEGTILTRDAIGTKKPGTGISASHLDELIGSRALRFIPKDVLLRREDVELGSETNEEIL